MPAATHADTENLNLQIVSSLNRANSMGFLTDALVAAANTVQGLLDAIDSVSVHNDQENWKTLLKRSIRVAGLSDSDILSLTTVAGLIALFPVTNSGNLVLE